VLKIEELTKTFPGAKKEPNKRVRAVDNISLEVREGQLYTLLGPSGCGKTTTLRCVAGLESPDEGEISIRDRVLFSSKKGIKLRANERGIGMVFQSYAIWPHMNVFENVAFPLRVADRNKRSSKKEIKERVERVLSVVRLDELADRQATDLSGGQQQRLALARALVMEPPLLLLDEPLSNLDAKLREDMRFELKRLQREFGITAVYVTHDQIEALAMSNVIAVMNDGTIQQIGKPREIYEQPMSRFVADFIGTSNFIEGVSESREAGGHTVSTSEGTLRVNSNVDFPAGTRVIVAVRPEHLKLDSTAPHETGPNRWMGKIEVRAFLGESVDHVVAVGKLKIRARCNPTQSIPPETEVTLTLPPEACSLIAAEE
jgi:iron(III) transport system ATP-binding protein